MLLPNWEIFCLSYACSVQSFGASSVMVSFSAAAMANLCLLRQVLFCSISGDIFPKATEQQRAELGLQHTTSAKDAHLQRLLPAILPSIAPPEAAIHNAAANNEAELLDACKYGLFLNAS
jgi:hypothetical protein